MDRDDDNVDFMILGHIFGLVSLRELVLFFVSLLVFFFFSFILYFTLWRDETR
jgi:hypothetical protein